MLPNFALFDVNKIQIIPGGPTPEQLPPFLQPIFTFVGLTPDTFTAVGHQHLLNLIALVLDRHRGARPARDTAEPQ